MCMTIYIYIQSKITSYVLWSSLCFSEKNWQNLRYFLATNWRNLQFISEFTSTKLGIFCMISLPILRFFFSCLMNFTILPYLRNAFDEFCNFFRDYFITIFTPRPNIYQRFDEYCDFVSKTNLTNIAIFFKVIWQILWLLSREYLINFYKDYVTNFAICFLIQFDELSYFFRKSIWRILWSPHLRSFCDFFGKSLCDFLDIYLRSFGEFEDFPLWYSGYVSVVNLQNSQCFWYRLTCIKNESRKWS